MGQCEMKQIKVPHLQNSECEKVSSVQEDSSFEASFLSPTNRLKTSDNYEVRKNALSEVLVCGA